MKKNRKVLKKSKSSAATQSRSRNSESKAHDEEGKLSVDAAIVRSEKDPKALPMELSKCKAVELQGYLRGVGLRASGLKDDLVQRVEVSFYFVIYFSYQ